MVVKMNSNRHHGSKVLANYHRRLQSHHFRNHFHPHAIHRGKPGDSNSSSTGQQRRGRKARHLERFRDYSVQGDDQRLWMVDQVEYRPDLQRILNDKYCRHCARTTDHSTKMCNNTQESPCIVCSGDHQSEQCNELRCAKCNRDHHERDCPVPVNVLRCESCKRDGHLDMLCTSNWRSFAMVTSLEASSFHDGGMINFPASTENRRRFCAHCGSNQHFYSVRVYVFL